MALTVLNVEFIHLPAECNGLAESFRSYQQCFKWLDEEGEIERNPRERIKPPKIVETLTKLLSDDEMRALLNVCAGRDFESRRDTGMIRLLIDSGMRRSELTRLRISDIDFHLNLVYIERGKGGKPRVLPFGHKTSRDLDRYLRARSRHGDSDLPDTWLGRAGTLTDSRMYQML